MPPPSRPWLESRRDTMEVSHKVLSTFQTNTTFPEGYGSRRRHAAILALSMERRDARFGGTYYWGGPSTPVETVLLRRLRPPSPGQIEAGQKQQTTGRRVSHDPAPKQDGMSG